MNRIISAVLFVLTLVIVSCGGQSTELDVELETAVGRIRLAEVQIEDRFPPGCEEGSFCSIANPGEKILIIWVEGSGSLDEIAALSGAFVVDADGKRTELGGNGIHFGRIFNVFYVPIDAHGFNLHSSDNPAIDLGK